MGWARGGWRCCGRSARPLCVATCAVKSCATRGSISPLFYLQLLATKAMTSRHTVGLLSTDGFASRHRHRHAGKPEMLTQGRSLVFAPEQTATLQFRDHEIDEIGE